MELFSHGTMMLGAASAFALPTKLDFSLTALLSPSFLLIFGCGQAVALLSLWLISKMVADEDKATFLNALKSWLFTLLAVLATGVGLAFAVPAIAHSGDQWRAGLVLFGAGMLMLTLIFLIPMKIYVIVFGRALLLVVGSFILQLIVQVGLQMTVFKGAASADSLAMMRGLAGNFAREAGPAAPVDTSPTDSNEIDALLNTALHPVGGALPLEQQEAQVKVLQQKLQARKTALPSGDAHAQLVFQNQLNRYLYFLNAVEALERVKSGTSSGSRTSAVNSHSTAH